jgi:fructose-specific phosphotransferase system IIC component
MFERIIATIIASVVGGLIGGVLTIAAWFVIAQGEKDPSAGGAYVAMAMLTCPVGFLITAIAVGVWVWRFLA